MRPSIPVSYTHLDVYKRQAVDHVVKAGLALGGHVLADDVRLAGVEAALDLLLGEVEAVLVVLERLSPALGLGARLVQPCLLYTSPAPPSSFTGAPQPPPAPRRIALRPWRRR